MQSLADIREDRLKMAEVRTFTRATLPLYCGGHRLVVEEYLGDYYCFTCGRMYVAAAAKRERRIRWQDGRRSELRQIQMAI